MTHKIFRVLSLMMVAFFLVSAAGFAEASAQGSALSRGYVGVVLGDTDSQDGVAIDTVLRRSPAYSAGIKDGDRILSVNGEAVRTPGKVQTLFRSQPVGRVLLLEIARDEETLRFEVGLTESPTSSEVHRLHLQGFEAPDISLHDLDGDAILIADLHDRPVVLEFWATWCTVCRQVSRKLEEAVEAAPDAFHVLAVTSEDVSTVQKHLTTRPMKLDIAIDDGNRAHDAFLVNSYPLVAVIDTDGTVRDVATSLSQIDEIIAALTEPDSPPEKEQESESED